MPSTLYELEPDLRPAFPHEVATHRQTLIAELIALAELGATAAQNGFEEFDRRRRELGERHMQYGARARHYKSAEVAMLAALERHVDGWACEHRAAWLRVNRLVAHAMQSAQLATAQR